MRRRFTRRSGYAVEHVLPEQLLKACLLEDERAVRYWQAWRPLVDEDDLDEGSHRLLPLLHENLSRLGVPNEALTKYKQVLRFYWYKNQLIASQTLPILQKMEEAGIPFLLLKGFPLAFHYYANPALRPFHDTDILVRKEDITRTVALCKGHSLVFKYDYDERSVYGVRHAVNLAAASGMDVDLHWRPLYRTWDGYGPTDIWDEADAFTFGSQRLPTATASLHFFQACLHGSDWSSVAPVRWAADAAVILRRADRPLDWEWIIRQAEHHRLSVRLKRQLLYLQTELNLPIPANVLQDLERSKRWTWEALEFKTTASPPNLFRKLLGFWFLHWRSQPALPLWKAGLTFPRFLRETLNIRKTDMLPAFIRTFRQWL